MRITLKIAVIGVAIISGINSGCSNSIDKIRDRSNASQCNLIQETTVPLSISKSKYGLLLVSAKINGVSGLFILDTGCGMTMITPDFARKANLTPDPLAENTVWTVNGVDYTKQEVKIFRVHSLEIGSANFSDSHAVVTNLDFFRQAVNPNIVGFLGNNILNQTVYTIDCKTIQFSLRKNSLLGNPNVMPITSNGDQIFVNGLFNRKKIRFSVDTGCNKTALIQADFLKASNSVKPTPVSNLVGGANGEIQVNQSQVSLDSLRVGDVERQNFPALVKKTMPVGNALGVDFLMGHVLTVDAKNKMTVLQ